MDRMLYKLLIVCIVIMNLICSNLISYNRTHLMRLLDTFFFRNSKIGKTIDTYKSL